ncbi:hypothetical protein BDZ85DRAFT_48115 [Elsinoe ampelina]|uniref:Uncharacterized protein n=1 Tax=Elsinoe ampelina TaxID=302913 RepID=A0A6A6GKT6_9PEZI|nr:hypothetical protein BDZ85DRAFT_48115 [Elsinoe ampelina]
MPFLTTEAIGRRGDGGTSLDANVPQLPLGTQLKPGELLVKLIAIGSEAGDQSTPNIRDFIGTVVAEGPLPARHGISNQDLARDTNGTTEQESVSGSRSASYTLVSRERVPILKRTSCGRYAPNWGTPTWTQSLYGQPKEEDAGSVIIGEVPEERSLDNGNSTCALVERNGAPVFRRTASGRHAPNWGTPTWPTGNKFDESIARLNGSGSVNGDEASQEDVLVRRTRPSIMKRVSSGRHAPQWNAPVFATRSVTSPAVVGASVPEEESIDVPDTSFNLTPRGRPGSIKRVSSGRHAPQWGSPDFAKPMLSPTPTPTSLVNNNAPITVLKRKASDDDGAYKLVQRNGSPVFKRVSSGRAVPQWSFPAFAQAESRAGKAEEEEQFTYRLVEREDGTFVFKKVPVQETKPVMPAPEPAAEEQQFTYRLVERPDGTSFFKKVPEEKTKPAASNEASGTEVVSPENETSTYRLVERADGTPVFKRVSSGRHAPQWSTPAFAQTKAAEQPVEHKFTYRLVDRADGTSVFRKVPLEPRGSDTATPADSPQATPTRPKNRKRVSSGRHAPQWGGPVFNRSPTAEQPVAEQFTYRLVDRPDGTSIFKKVPLTHAPSIPDHPLPTASTSPTPSDASPPTKRTLSGPILKRTSSGRHAPQWSSPLFSASPTTPAQQAALSGSTSAPDLPDQKFTYRMLEREDGTPVFKRVSFYLPHEASVAITADPGPAVQEKSVGAERASRPVRTPEQPYLKNAKVRKGQVEGEKQGSLVGKVVFGSSAGMVLRGKAGEGGYITVEKGEVAGQWKPKAGGFEGS